MHCGGRGVAQARGALQGQRGGGPGGRDRAQTATRERDGGGLVSGTKTAASAEASEPPAEGTSSGKRGGPIGASGGPHHEESTLPQPPVRGCEVPQPTFARRGMARVQMRGLSCPPDLAPERLRGRANAHAACACARARAWRTALPASQACTPLRRPSLQERSRLLTGLGAHVGEGTPFAPRILRMCPRVHRPSLILRVSRRRTRWPQPPAVPMGSERAGKWHVAPVVPCGAHEWANRAGRRRALAQPPP